ncbi:hypothetical protein FRC00_008713 [Tulasnella sp. 408]|nr:hypothetical protein FRC00_008713 [Tulasnella sp. 408]
MSRAVAASMLLEDATELSYSIYSKGTNGVIDLDMGKDENGTSINIWGHTEARQQRWKFEKVRDLGGDHRDDRREVPGDQQPLPQLGGVGGGRGSARRYQGAVPPGKYWVRNAHSGTAMDLSGRNPMTVPPLSAIRSLKVTTNRLHNVATGTYLSVRPNEQLQDGVLPTGNSNIRTEWDVQGDPN